MALLRCFDTSYLDVLSGLPSPLRRLEIRAGRVDINTVACGTQFARTCDSVRGIDSPVMR